MALSALQKVRVYWLSATSINTPTVQIYIHGDLLLSAYIPLMFMRFCRKYSRALSRTYLRQNHLRVNELELRP